VSIFAHLIRETHGPRPSQLRLLYATKATPPMNADEILFVSRLVELAKRHSGIEVDLRLHLTGVSQDDIANAKGLPEHTNVGRVTGEDLEAAIGAENDRSGAVCYVCGPPAMTDSMVGFLGSRKGMESRRVLCEKWW